MNIKLFSSLTRMTHRASSAALWGALVWTGAATATASAIPQEMPSRVHNIANQIQANETLRLRSANAPIYQVALSPTKQKIEAAAISAKRGKAASEKSVSALLGVDKEPPVAPYYVGPVFESGMAATTLNWQQVPGGNITDSARTGGEH